MKRVPVRVEMTRRTFLAFEVEENADTEGIRETGFDKAELAEWDDDPPEVMSITIIEPVS